MRNFFLKKITSLALVMIMLFGVVPAFFITSIATELKDLETVIQDGLDSSDDLIKEVEQREGVTKDRSGIESWAQAGVYVDGVLVAQGDFSSMWNRAMEHAPNINAYTTDKQIEQMREVEYVFNTSMPYDYTWFGEETMTVSGKKFTIDLNGNSLYRTDKGGSVIMVDNYSVLTIMDSDPDSNSYYYIDDEFFEESEFSRPSIKGGIIAGGYYKTGDGGKTWELYSAPIDASEITSESKAFSVSYGAKSETVDMDLGVHVGSMIVDSGYAFLIGGVGLIVLGIVVAIIKRKNKVDA